MRKKTFTKKNDEEFDQVIKSIKAAGKRLNKFSKSLGLELYDLSPVWVSGFGFKHEEFVIKANFLTGGIDFQSNVMSIRCMSIVNKLKENKDLMKIYLAALEGGIVVD